MLTPIGQILKAAREQRGLSLLDAAHETRIPVNRLHLLEQDNYAAFGSMTYARCFLRQYSQYLGVDASAILDELPGGALGGPRDYRYLVANHGPWVLSREARLGQLSQQASRAHARRSPVPAGLAVFVLVLAGTGMWGKYVAEDRLAEQEPAAAQPPPAAEVRQLSAGAKPGLSSAPIVPLPVRILKAVPVEEEEGVVQSPADKSANLE